MSLSAASIDAALALDASFEITARWRVSVDADGRFAHREEAVAPVVRKAYDPITRDDLLDLLDGDDATGEMRLACVDGRVVARAAVSAAWHGYGRLDEIAVDRAWRGRGIGRALLDWADGWARSRGLGGLMLETQDNNAAACRFYARHGFALGGLDRCVYANRRPGAAEIALYWYRPFATGEGGA